MRALLDRSLAIAAVAVAAQGCSDAGKPGPDLSGRWAMFAFEDPVAVDIQQAGGAIEGRGCCIGFPGDREISCCGPLNGQMVDRRASFGFSFENGGEPYMYSTDAFVSSDGNRMAGTFSRGGQVAWVRIPAYAPYLPLPTSALESVAAGRYTLVLSDDPGGGSDFSSQRTYGLMISAPRFVHGDLGSFWSGEMAWNADQQTLVVGPVPETAPGLPVAMSLRFDGTALASVEAVMASGARYQFQATLWQP